MISYVQATSIVAWSGVVKTSTPFWYEEKWNKNPDTAARRPSHVFGEIALYPGRPDRWIETREMGWVPLNLYFKTYKQELIDVLLPLPARSHMVFWGKIRTRHLFPSDTELRDLTYEFDLEWLIKDRSKGKQSFIQASLLCSDNNELKSY